MNRRSLLSLFAGLPLLALARPETPTPQVFHSAGRFTMAAEMNFVTIEVIGSGGGAGGYAGKARSPA